MDFEKKFEINPIVASKTLKYRGYKCWGYGLIRERRWLAKIKQIN